MTIVQDAYYIPDDIATGLATGVYRRFGSVIRHAAGANKGQIVTHLDPVNMKTAEQAQRVENKILQLAQHHKKEAGIAAVGVALIGASVWGYNKWKNHEPKVLTKFRSALKMYIDAIRNGNMDIGIINNLMEALESLRQYKDYVFKELTKKSISEDLEILVGRIYDYTIKLATDNNVEWTEDELNPDDGVIINLQSCLKTQKRIFEAVA